MITGEGANNDTGGGVTDLSGICDGYKKWRDGCERRCDGYKRWRDGCERRCDRRKRWRDGWTKWRDEWEWRDERGLRTPLLNPLRGRGL